MSLFRTSYRSINESADLLYKSKGSKFYTFAFPVVNEQQIKDKLNELRLRYPDATHHCYAYCLYPDASIFRANDDGEPSGTAGRPILRQIQKLELTNTLVVVVRYFGGTLLGVPGLIEAYGDSAAECLAKCSISEHDIYEIYQLDAPFGIENEVYKLCKQLRLSPILLNSNDYFSVQIKVPLRMADSFKKAVSQHYQLKLKYIGAG